MNDHARLRTATHIDVEAEVRYWEDARVDGVDDADGSRIPGKVGDLWKVRIDLETGRIENWRAGVRASIHYKVCDQGEYWLSDANGARIAKWNDHYVPGGFLCHGDSGFGDYIIMNVDGEGRIAKYHRPAIEDGDWSVL